MISAPFRSCSALEEAGTPRAMVKLFISWSGELSHQIALHLKKWLPVVLPFVEPWVSSEDIPKGTRWGAELATQLEGTASGIVCLVPGNVHEPWLNFEATRFAKDDVRKLVRDINSEADAGTLPPDRVDRSFEVCWPDLGGRLAPLLAEAEASSAASARQDPPRNEPAASPPTEEELKLLRAIANANDGLRRDQAAAVVGVHPQHAQHVMESLEEQGLLVAAHNYLYGSSWHLSRDGSRARRWYGY
jgi:hypothetical protein